MADNVFKNIVVHHGGQFNHPKKRKGKARKYVGGKVTEIELDQDRVSYVSILEVLMSICDLPEGFFFVMTYKSPNFKDLDPFEIVSNDKELMDMFEATSNLPKIHLYVTLEHSPPPIRDFCSLNPVGSGTIDEDDLANQVDSFHGGDVSSKLGAAARDSDDSRSERGYNIKTLHSPCVDDGHRSDFLHEATIDGENLVFQKGMEFSNIKMQEFPDPSCEIQNGTNACTMASNANCILLRPVLSVDCGVGFPYAPNDWPLPGDKWVWKTGNRKSHGGYWRDRRLHPPQRLKKGAGFRTKSSVREYIEQEFPDANVDAFFSSFHWRIPCIEQSQTKATNKQDRKRSSPGSSLKGKSVNQIKAPTRVSRRIKLIHESFSPATESRVDLPHPNDPAVETIDIEEMVPKISGPVMPVAPVNLVVGCGDMVPKQSKTPHGSECAVVGAESCVPATKSRVDLCQPNDSGDVEMITRQETNPNISTPVPTLIPVNSVVGHATCTCSAEDPLGSLRTSHEQVAAMETAIEFPDVIHRALTSALKHLTNELTSTPLESLGDKMGYFHDHVAWFAHFKFPVEEFKQNLNSMHSRYQEKIARRREIEVEQSEIEKEVLELNQKVSKLHQKAEKLRYEIQSLFWLDRYHFANF